MSTKENVYKSERQKEKKNCFVYEADNKVDKIKKYIQSIFNKFLLYFLYKNMKHKHFLLLVLVVNA